MLVLLFVCLIVLCLLCSVSVCFMFSVSVSGVNVCLVIVHIMV